MEHTSDTKEPEYDGCCVGNRWLAYFDLLGIKHQVQNKSVLDVYSVYDYAIRQVLQKTGRTNRVQYAWFSDTFLFFSKDDSASSFAEIEAVSRWYAYFLISHEVPLRGAIACGEFYADTKHQVYVGKALVEAYEYGEAQDWIGFILCPSVVSQLERLDLPANERLHYRLYEYPNKKPSSKFEIRLPACLIGNYACQHDGRNPAIQALESMKAKLSQSTENTHILNKYENTIRFLKPSTQKLP